MFELQCWVEAPVFVFVWISGGHVDRIINMAADIIITGIRVTLQFH